MKHISPTLAVDALIIYNEKLVLIKRGNPPYKDQFALPGGLVEIGETVEAAAVREAKEETDLDIEIVRLLGVYSDPSRDPRGHTVAIVFLAVGKGNIKAGSDAKDIELVDLTGELPKLAFDHNKIIEEAKDDILDLLSTIEKLHIHEFVTVEMKIVRDMTGNTAYHKLIAHSDEISDEFKDELWEDFSIDIDDLFEDIANAQLKTENEEQV